MYSEEIRYSFFTQLLGENLEANDQELSTGDSLEIFLVVQENVMVSLKNSDGYAIEGAKTLNLE